MYRLIESLDAFVDHGEAFHKYLLTQELNEGEVTVEDLELRLRTHNRVHPKVSLLGPGVPSRLC